MAHVSQWATVSPQHRTGSQGQPLEGNSSELIALLLVFGLTARRHSTITGDVSTYGGDAVRTDHLLQKVNAVHSYSLRLGVG